MKNQNAKLLLLNIDKLTQTQKGLLRSFIISIIEDLKKWVEEIFVFQTAQDIHYLDTSFFANITQIEIMIKNQTQGEENGFN